MSLEYTFVFTTILLVCYLADKWLRTRVFGRWKPLIFAFIIYLVFGIIWDHVAVIRGHWVYGWQYLSGVKIGLVPVEDVLVVLDIILVPVIAWEYFRKNGKTKK